MLLFTLAAALAAANAGSAPAEAQENVAAPLVGNTIEVRYGTAVMITVLAADGTFKMKLPNGKRTSGDWIADNRYLCWITKEPAAAPGKNLRCETMVHGKRVGDTWTQTDSYGSQATVTLVAGDKL